MQLVAGQADQPYGSGYDGRLTASTGRSGRNSRTSLCTNLAWLNPCSWAFRLATARAGSSMSTPVTSPWTADQPRRKDRNFPNSTADIQNSHPRRDSSPRQETFCKRLDNRCLKDQTPPLPVVVTHYVSAGGRGGLRHRAEYIMGSPPRPSFSRLLKEVLGLRTARITLRS